MNILNQLTFAFSTGNIKYVNFFTETNYKLNENTALLKHFQELSCFIRYFLEVLRVPIKVFIETWTISSKNLKALILFPTHKKKKSHDFVEILSD